MTVTAPAPTVLSGPTLVRVLQLNGQPIEVQGKEEEKFYNEQRQRYLDENAFTAASDRADLDRLIFLELLDFRWRGWLSSGKDYDGLLTPQQEEQLRRNLKDNSPLISQVKNDLGLTKSQRDKEKAESVGSYITTLKTAAKQHGVRREKQLTKAICLIKELFSLVGTFDRSNQLERSKIGLDTSDDVLDWIRQIMKPGFDEIDEYFRANEQRFFVGKL